MPKDLTPEFLGPPGEDHAYDSPELNPKDFLSAVYHDKRLPMSTRIEAAKAAAVYEHPRLQQVSQDVNHGVRVIVEGGLPQLPGTNIIMPGMQPEATRKTNGHGS